MAFDEYISSTIGNTRQNVTVEMKKFVKTDTFRNIFLKIYDEKNNNDVLTKIINIYENMTPNYTHHLINDEIFIILSGMTGHSTSFIMHKLADRDIYKLILINSGNGVEYHGLISGEIQKAKVIVELEIPKENIKNVFALIMINNYRKNHKINTSTTYFYEILIKNIQEKYSLNKNILLKDVAIFIFCMNINILI